MEINSTKTQIMAHSEGSFISEIKINNEPLKVVERIIDDKGSKADIGCTSLLTAKFSFVISVHIIIFPFPLSS